MLNLNHKTKIVVSQEIPIMTGYTVDQEGMCLAQMFENGIEKCIPSTGAAGEIFMGFSYHETRTPSVKSKVENVVCPAASPYTITLASTPLAGQIYIVNEDGTAQVAGDPANANEYDLTGAVLTFHSGQAGKVQTITYRYSPTVNELMFMDKVSTTTWDSPESINSTGVIQSGTVYTDQFDASVDWANASAVKLDAGGILTDQTGGGTDINATIVHFPNEELPMLGVRFSAL